MIDALVVVVLVAAAALAVFGLVTTALRRPPGRPMRVAVGAVVALLVVQALIAGSQVFLGGVTLAETSTFLIYLVVSVCVLPIAAQFAAQRDDIPSGDVPTGDVPTGDARQPTAQVTAGGPTRWGGAVIAVGAVATVVAVVRLQSLWQVGGPGG